VILLIDISVYIQIR